MYDIFDFEQFFANHNDTFNLDKFLYITVIIFSVDMYHPDIEKRFYKVWIK